MIFVCIKAGTKNKKLLRYSLEEDAENTIDGQRNKDRGKNTQIANELKKKKMTGHLVWTHNEQ